MKRELSTEALLRERDKYRDEIVERFTPLVFSVAKKCSRKISSDLLQDGMVGLMRAIDGFDEAKGVKFITYAYYMVWGTMMEGIHRGNVFGNRRFGETYCSLLGMSGKFGDGVDAHKKEVEAVKAIKKNFTPKSVDSVDQVYLNGVVPIHCVANKIEDKSTDIEDIDNRDELNYIKKCLLNCSDVSARSKDIFIRYFYEGESARSIAKLYNVTVTRVHQINDCTGKHLREVLLPHMATVSY